jgi:uncharacterized membrane protein HdeD (DUF308 family)
MITFSTRSWRIYVFRGILALIFGLVALFWPGITLHALVLVFGVYVLLRGALLIFAALDHKAVSQQWGLLLIEGIISVLFALVAFIWTGITALALLLLIAAWALLSGILEIVAAIQLRKLLKGEWVLGLIGIISILLAFILLIQPEQGALAVVTVIGFYAIFGGILMLYLAYKLRRLPDQTTLEI